MEVSCSKPKNLSPHHAKNILDYCRFDLMTYDKIDNIRLSLGLQFIVQNNWMQVLVYLMQSNSFQTRSNHLRV